jgi:hypothetical protein
VKPSQKEFDTCRKVLEFIKENTEKHESYAISTIQSVENALEANSFNAEDYVED